MFKYRLLLSYIIVSIAYFTIALFFLYYFSIEKKNILNKENILEVSLNEFIEEPIEEELEEKEQKDEPKKVEEEILPTPIPTPIVTPKPKPKPKRKPIIKKKKRKKVVKKRVKKRKVKRKKYFKKKKRYSKKKISKAKTPKFSQKDKNIFNSKIRAKINRYKSYPSMAKRRRIEGRVRVNFRLLKNGKITNIKLSGNSIFFSSAKKALKKASPINIKNAPFKLPKNFSVTLNYRLR